MPETKIPVETQAPRDGRGNTALLERPMALEDSGTALPPAENTGEGKKTVWVRTGPFLIGLVLLCLLVLGGNWGIHVWNYSKTHISTDDAQITGNMINISPTISGTLKTLTVEEGS